MAHYYGQNIEKFSLTFINHGIVFINYLFINFISTFCILSNNPSLLHLISAHSYSSDVGFAMVASFDRISKCFVTNPQEYLHRMQLGEFLIWKIRLLKTQHSTHVAELNKMAAVQSNIPERQLPYRIRIFSSSCRASAGPGTRMFTRTSSDWSLH